VNSYTIHKVIAMLCMLLAGLTNYFIGVGNSLFLMLMAIYFQLCAMEYEKKEQVQA
jgi:hypothetical protein